MQIADILVNQIMSDPRFKNNSTMQNAFSMYRNGNISGVEELAKNTCQTQGRDINELLSQARGLINRR